MGWAGRGATGRCRVVFGWIGIVLGGLGRWVGSRQWVGFGWGRNGWPGGVRWSGMVWEA